MIFKINTNYKNSGGSKEERDIYGAPARTFCTNIQIFTNENRNFVCNDRMIKLKLVYFNF